MEYAYFRPVCIETLGGSTDNAACFVSRNGYNRGGASCSRKWVMRAIRSEWSTFLRYGFYWQWNRWSARRQK